MKDDKKENKRGYNSHHSTEKLRKVVLELKDEFKKTIEIYRSIALDTEKLEHSFEHLKEDVISLFKSHHLCLGLFSLFWAVVIQLIMYLFKCFV